MDFILLWASIVAGLLVFTLGHNLGKRSVWQEPLFITNSPKTTVVYPDKICYGWKGNYNTQVTTCIKRGK